MTEAPSPEQVSSALKKKWPSWVKVLGALACLGIAGLVILYLGVSTWFIPTIQQWILPQSPQTAQQQAKTVIQVKKGAPFKLLQAIDILGVKLVRLESTQTAQVFVTISGLDAQTSEALLNDTPDPRLLEAMGNSVLKLRNPQQPPELTIKTLDIVETGHLQIGSQTLPYQHLRIHFKLSNEKEDRDYEGVIGRYQSPQGHESILISYSKAGQYHPKLLKSFMQSIELHP